MVVVTTMNVILKTLGMNTNYGSISLGFIIAFGLTGCFVYNRLDTGGKHRIYIPLYTILGNILLMIACIFILKKMVLGFLITLTFSGFFAMNVVSKSMDLAVKNVVTDYVSAMNMLFYYF